MSARGQTGVREVLPIVRDISAVYLENIRANVWRWAMGPTLRRLCSFLQQTGVVPWSRKVSEIATSCMEECRGVWDTASILLYIVVSGIPCR